MGRRLPRPRRVSNFSTIKRLVEDGAVGGWRVGVGIGPAELWVGGEATCLARAGWVDGGKCLILVKR